MINFSRHESGTPGHRPGTDGWPASFGGGGRDEPCAQRGTYPNVSPMSKGHGPPRQIDQLVYELYGLTDDEIRMVDEATN